MSTFFSFLIAPYVSLAIPKRLIMMMMMMMRRRRRGMIRIIRMRIMMKMMMVYPDENMGRFFLYSHVPFAFDHSYSLLPLPSYKLIL